MLSMVLPHSACCTDDTRDTGATILMCQQGESGHMNTYRANSACCSCVKLGWALHKKTCSPPVNELQVSLAFHRITPSWSLSNSSSSVCLNLRFWRSGLDCCTAAAQAILDLVRYKSNALFPALSGCFSISMPIFFFKMFNLQHF